MQENTFNLPGRKEYIRARMKEAFRSIGEYAQMATELEWAVDRLVPLGSVIVLAGPAKRARKSLLTMALAIAVSQGLPFLGRKTKQGLVMMIDLDGGPARYARRSRLFGAFNADTNDLPIVALTAKRYTKEVPEYILEAKPRIAIVDTMNKALIQHGAKSESDNIELGKILGEYQDAAQEANTAIIVIHHMDKLDNNYRGGTAIDADTDGMLFLTQTGTPSDPRRLHWRLRDGLEGHQLIDVCYTERPSAEGGDYCTVGAAGLPEEGAPPPERKRSSRSSNSNSESRGISDTDIYNRLCVLLQEAGAGNSMSFRQLREGAGAGQKKVQDQLKRLQDAGLAQKGPGRNDGWTWIGTVSNQNETNETTSANNNSPAETALGVVS